MAGKNRGFCCLLLVVLACTLSRACLARSVERNELDTQLRHRRSLLAAKPQQISQCEWISGEGCALHPSYVTYALNKTRNDVVGGYVSRALACAGVVEKGACEGVSYCFWDSSFTNGQQGCFLHESAMLSLQQQCIKPASRDSLEKLQSCMEARHSCQCNGGATSNACQMRQQQLLASYSTSSSKVCQSLLGCWLSKLNNSSPDVMQLVEVQLALVQPMMESLIPRSLNVPASSSSSTLTGRRRSLQQNLPALSDPILNDKMTIRTEGSNSVGQLESGSLQFESGSLVPGIPEPEGSPKPASSPPASAVGMNGGIWNDEEASSPTGAPVEGGKGIPGPTQSSPDLQLESGTMPGDDWDFEQGTPVDPDQVFGNKNTTSNSSNSSDNSGEVQMTGGNAPASFWKCVGTAAIKADTTRKWADVDYNSKALTLATWIRVIQPTALIDWGVQVMECFKADVTTLPLNTASPDKANKESMEYAIVALIRVFSAEADAFRAYLQAGQSSRAAAGMAGLQTLSAQVFPDQLRNLQSTYNKTAAYDRDVMLQAAALIADMQWFTSDAVALASNAGGSAAQQQQVFEAVVSYGEEMMRRCLFWLFHIQFAGPPAHLRGVPTTHAASTAVMDAFDGLAAAALPAQVVAADAPAWQQVQGMMAVAAGWAASAAAIAKPANGQLDDAVQLGNAVDGLAKAHIQDFWGTRVELARAAAPDTSRQLALLDPTQQSAGYQPLRDQQLQLFAALQQHVAAGDAASAASYLQLNQKLRDVVTASGSFLLSGSSNAQLADALQYSSWLAALIRQCRGSPAGLRPFSAVALTAAGVPATAAAACNQLTAEANQMAAAALAGTSTADAVRSNLADNINKQWMCAASDPDRCSSVPGCQLALLGTLVPGTSTTGSSSAAANAELLLQGTAASGLQFACQADDAGLLLSSYPKASKSDLGISPACQTFLELPACESIEQAGRCDASSACRWELTAERNLLHTAGNVSSAAAAKVAKNSTTGVCAMDWAEVLSSGSSTAYSSLQSMISQCSDISDVAACTAQTMMLTLDTSQGSTSNIARIWVPALVVAAVLGLLLFGGVMYWRRRSTIARRAAEEARSAGAGGRGSGKKGKDKDGKAKNKNKPKKAKRAEPGSYKPDLMRDSFTDYMRSAPQQFENGVAIAKAAMAAGSLDAAVAATDVAGGRAIAVAATSGAADAYLSQVPHQQQQQQQQQGTGVMGISANRPRMSGGLPPLPPMGGYPMPAASVAGTTTTGLATVNTNDLIDLQNDVGMHRASPVQQQQQQQTGAYPMHSIMYSGSVWGAAGGTGPATNSQVSASLSGGLLSSGLSSQMDLMDAGASLALTSSLGLVSSVPQHASVALGVADAQQYLDPTAVAAGQGVQPESAVLGLPGPAVCNRSISGRSVAAGGVDRANSGSVLLARHASGDIEDGSATPTSSCCHDSVCTFRHGAGSVVGSQVGSRAGAPISASSSWRSSTNTRAGGSGRALSSSGAASTGQGLGTALSGALSGALSRSSWSSAMSTDILLGSQHSAAVDP